MRLSLTGLTNSLRLKLKKLRDSLAVRKHRMASLRRILWVMNLRVYRTYRTKFSWKMLSEEKNHIEYNVKLDEI